MKNFLSLSVAFVVLLIGGFAQAEVITYQFTASIVDARDPNRITGLTTGETVTGTFSFDTEARAATYSGWGGSETYRNTGEIETDAVTIDGGIDGIYLDGTFLTNATTLDLDGLAVLDSETNGTVTNLSTGSVYNSYYAVESIHFYFGDSDTFSGNALPTSIDLNDFDGADYSVQIILKSGRQAYVKGHITSVTRVGSGGGSTAVPELSAQGTVSAFTLMVGGAYVISTRRRHGEAS